MLKVAFFVVAWLAEPYVGSTTHFNTSLSLINHRICWFFFLQEHDMENSDESFHVYFSFIDSLLDIKKYVGKTTATSPI